MLFAPTMEEVSTISINKGVGVGVRVVQMTDGQILKVILLPFVQAHVIGV